MQKFNELTEEQMAALTAEEIDSYTKAALMEKGIRVYERPEPFLHVKPGAKKQKWFRVHGCYFQSQPLAEKFIALAPRVSDYNWEIGSEIKYSKTIDPQITVEELYDEKEVLDKGPEFIAWKHEYQEWNTQENRHRAFVRDTISVHNEIRSKIDKAKEALREKAEILSAYEEYKVLADGDELIAQKFLLKNYESYGKDKVRAAIGLAPLEPEKTEQTETAQQQVEVTA